MRIPLQQHLGRAGQVCINFDWLADPSLIPPEERDFYESLCETCEVEDPYDPAIARLSEGDEQ